MTKKTELQQYALSFAECRTFGHAWSRTDINDPAYNLVLACARCTTKRYDHVSRATGALFARRYDYPETYALVERSSRNDYRRELLRRRTKRAS